MMNKKSSSLKMLSMCRSKLSATLDGKHAAEEVRQSVFMYVEAYYNRIRMHSALDYVAPNVFNSGQVV
ncbi:MAG: hypothetical protein LBD79_09415 [Treponema sp.]|jgi:transposase InsO family protein|nr:hypothetical protein [Treponema sp.]